MGGELRDRHTDWGLSNICSKIKNKDRYGARLYTWRRFGSESCILKRSSRFVSNASTSLAQRGATTWWTRLYLGLFQGIWRCNVAISERASAVRLQDGYFIYICCTIWWPFAGRAMYLWQFQSNSYFQMKICVWKYDIRCKQQKKPQAFFQDIFRSLSYAKKPTLHCIFDISELSRGALLNSKCRFKGGKKNLPGWLIEYSV